MASVSDRIDIKNKAFLVPTLSINSQNASSLRKPHRNSAISKRKLWSNENIYELLNTHLQDPCFLSFPQLLDPDISVYSRLKHLLSLFTAQELSKCFPFLETIRKIVSSLYEIPSIFEDCDISNKLMLCIDQGEVSAKTEALWTLVNLTHHFSNYTNWLVNSDAIKVLGNVIENYWNEESSELAMWVISHILLEQPNNANSVISLGTFSFLIEKISGSSHIPIDKATQTSWLLSNIIRSQKLGNENSYKEYLKVAPKLLSLVPETILIDTIWGLNHISKFTNNIKAIFDLHCNGRVFEIMSRNNEKSNLAGLRFFGNIICGEHSYVEGVLKLGLIDQIFQILGQSGDHVKREAFWVICNISLDCQEYADEIISHPGLELITNSISSIKIDMKIEALSCLKSILYMSSRDLVNQYLDSFIDKIVSCMRVKDSSVALLALDCCELAFKSVSRSIKTHKILIKKLDELQGLDAIENLQLQPNTEVYIKAQSLIMTYINYSDPPTQQKFEFT